MNNLRRLTLLVLALASIVSSAAQPVAEEQYGEPIGPDPAPGVESAQGDNNPEIQASEVQAEAAAWDDPEPWGGDPPPWYEDPASVNCEAAPSWCDGNGTVAA